MTHPPAAPARAGRYDLARDIREATRGAALIATFGCLLGVLYASWRLDPNRRK